MTHLVKGDVVGGFFEMLLSGNDVIREDTTCCDDLCEVVSEIVDVKGNLCFVVFAGFRCLKVGECDARKKLRPRYGPQSL